MENHKLDRLFQDKLSRHEVDPSPQAWEAINAEIRKDNKPMVWLSIAASVALIATIGWLVMRNDQEVVLSGEFANHIFDQPSPQSPYEWNLPLSAEKQPAQQVEVKKVVKKKITVEREEIPMMETLAQQNIEPMMVEDLLQIESIGLDAMANITGEPMVVEESPLDTTPIQSLPGMGVQITYKASVPAPVEEKSRIEKLWAKAKDIKPGDVLADLRETKNDFFNGKKN
jgi:hypothetical protein